MTRIDGASGMAALIRAQALEQARSRHAAGPKTDAGEGDSAVKKSLGDGRLQASLLQRLRSLDAQDPDRWRKAFRMFMEDALLREWGASMQADPQFPGLVDQVLERMLADPALTAASREAAELLLAQAAMENAPPG